MKEEFFSEEAKEVPYEEKTAQRLKLLMPVLGDKFGDAVMLTGERKQVTKMFSCMDLATCLEFLKSKGLCAQDGCNVL